MLVVSTLLFNFANAETATLNTLVNQFHQSPKAQKSESEQNEAKWKKYQSYEAVLPNIYGRANHYFNQKYFFLNPNTTYAVGFQLPLFDGFANYARINSAGHFEKGAINSHQWNLFSGEREVILQFYKTLAAKSLAEVAKRNLKALDDHLNDVQLFKKSGISTKFDVLKVEVQKSEAESELMNANDNVRNALTRLGEILGRDFDQVDIEGNLPLLDRNLIKDDEQNVKRLDLIALDEKVKALDSKEYADNKFYVPKIAFFGEYIKYNQTNKEFTGSEYFKTGYNVGINLTWTLFDGMKSISNDQISYEQKYQTLKTLEMAKTKASNDKAYWKRKFNYFLDVYRARKADIERANESVRLAKEGRKVGTRTNTDLLDAEADLYRSEAGAINAQVNSIEALINYELATGQQIYNF